MIPDKPIILTGKTLEEFEKYQNRTPTKEELDYVKEADIFFKSHLPEKQ